MAQPLEVQEKKELVAKGEKTVPARYYVPSTDIFETDDALKLVMEVPGVDRKDIDIRLEEDVLRVEARIDRSKYDGMEPLYTEYGVGHFTRSFTLSHRIDQQQIAAALSDGVLTLTLKKVQQAQPRRIEIR
ncbi:MAG: Hsp20/alpha crystallin family protein [Alphaproteobacteria bacterium]|nr:Hsp20/alpha crystallin family protein [Alphaproteobacteria bacterium]MBV8412627.1 Hsp20/alpha crystallin family protein [Alphaproteobacteria bacterium]